MPTDIPAWTDRYPDPDRIRAEVRAAADTYVDALWAVIPSEDIAGLYVKGSGLKTWDSPLDYVPVLSDVDIHVLFTDDDAVARAETMLVALALSREAEARFHAAVPAPIHIPRLQLVTANNLFAAPDYVPSPAETVEKRFGVPYPVHEVDAALRRSIAIQKTLEHAEAIAKLPRAVYDLTGPHLRRILRDLSWKISPTAPHLLELADLDFATCWTSNRTRLTQLLDTAGYPELAMFYRDFYLYSWEYFFSHDQDGQSARQAIDSAYRLLISAIEIASRATLVS